MSKKRPSKKAPQRDQDRKRDRIRDKAVIAYISAMLAVVVLCTLTLFKLSTLNNTPSWWNDIQSTSTLTEQSGIELENRITSALTRLRPQGQEDWAAAIDQDQLNSWLAFRLRDTLESFNSDSADDLDSIDDIRIQITHDGMTIGTKLTHTRGSTIVWALIEPGTDDQGRFAINTKRVYIGTSRIPTYFANSYLNSDRLGKASVDLGDGRTVHIRGIRTGDRRLEFALRTESTPDS